jgi:hypothetical protein
MTTGRFRCAALLICAAFAVMLVLPGLAEARGRSSNFVMTPNGPVPRSVMFAGNMTPQQLAASQKAELAEYEQAMKRVNPQMYKQYMDAKKAQQKSNNTKQK